jgi:hypothetical protein
VADHWSTDGYGGWAIGTEGARGLLAAIKHSARRTEDLTIVCFKAKPGREYTVRTLTEGGVWQIELLDDETSDNVKDFCD